MWLTAQLVSMVIVVTLVAQGAAVALQGAVMLSNRIGSGIRPDALGFAALFEALGFALCVLGYCFLSSPSIILGALLVALSAVLAAGRRRWSLVGVEAFLLATALAAILSIAAYRSISIA